MADKDQHQKATTPKHESWVSKLARVREEMDQLKDMISDMKIKVETNNAKLETKLETAIAKLETDTTTLKTAVAKLEIDFANL